MRFLLRLAPRGNRIAAVQSSRDRAELLLRLLQLALGDREQAINRERDAFVERSFCSKRSRPRRNVRLGLRPDLGFQILDVLPDGLHRFRATRPRDRRAGGDRRGCETPRGRSLSMKVITPRSVSTPTLTNMAGGSLTLSRAALMSRGVCRSFDRMRRARSASGA